MRHDERYRSGPLSLYVQEVNLSFIRCEAVMREYRKKIDLRLPIKVLDPVTAEIFQELKIESISPSQIRYLIRPASSFET